MKCNQDDTVWQIEHTARVPKKGMRQLQGDLRPISTKQLHFFIYICILIVKPI